MEPRSTVVVLEGKPHKATVFNRDRDGFELVTVWLGKDDLRVFRLQDGRVTHQTDSKRVYGRVLERNGHDKPKPKEKPKYRIIVRRRK